MHITCQECETVFNLDEHLLKPEGSKVRCSQCGNIFVAWPPAPMPEPEPEPLLEPEPEQPEAFATPQVGQEAAVSETSYEVGDQDLEGIDLAELDAILDSDSEPQVNDEPNQGNQAPEEVGGVSDDLSGGLLDEEDLIQEDEETDLDLDFDMNLEPAGDQGQGAEAGIAESDELLDDIDLDMDFELDDGFELAESAIESPEPAVDELEQPPVEQASVETDDQDFSEDDLELALDDFDLDSVEIEPEPLASENIAPSEAGEPGLESEIEEPDLSLDNLDMDLEEPGQVEDAAPAEASEDLEFEDFDLAPLSGQEKQVEDEELSLAPDDLEQEPVAEAPAAVETEKEDLDSLDLDDFNLDEIIDEVDEDAEPVTEEPVEEEELSLMEDVVEDEQPETAEQVPAEEDDLDLKLDELDLGDHEADDTLAESLSEEAPEEEAGQEQELELSLDDKAAGDISDDLDLSDLDGLLDDSGDAAEPDENDALDMELSLDDEQVVEEEKPSGDLELEDLEFELDAEVEDKPIAKTTEPEPVVEAEAEEEEEEELDLSDIEQMLEGDTLLTSSPLEREASTAKEPESTGASLGDELDLSEFEDAIDSPGVESEEAVLGDDDLELDLDLPSDEKPAEPAKAVEDAEELDLELDLEDSPVEPAAGIESPELELELEDEDEELRLEMDDQDIAPREEEEEELDLSDLDGLVVEQKAGVQSETIDTGDIELEFEVEDNAVPAAVESADDKTQVFQAGLDFPIEETLSAQTQPVAAKASPKPRPKKKKKGTSKLLVVVLVLVAIVAGGYLGYDPYIKDFLEQHNIQIPYLSQFLNPAPKDPAGTNNLSILDINSKFIESEGSGRLFVISGKVRNGYKNNRGNILLNGKLFSKGKVLVKSEKAYAGELFSDQDLKAMPIADIKQNMTKMPGTQDAKNVVRPGQTIPFMVVFSELPEDLDEFVVEKVSSQQVP